MKNIFNLLAEIVCALKRYPVDYEPDALTKEAEEDLAQEVMLLLNRWKNELNKCATNRLSSDTYDDIIAWLMSHNNYHSSRTLLCMLDSFPDIGLEETASEAREEGFISLNDNVEETGIIILPKVYRPRTTYIKRISTDPVPYDEVDIRKNANEWADNLNARLNYIYYICTNELKGYRVVNHVCNFGFGDLFADEIKIGAAPLLNLKLTDVLSINDNIRCKNESGMECQYFDILGVKQERVILERVQACFRLACEQNVDILFFPEMLGIEDLYDIDNWGFNPALRELSRSTRENVPHLIMMPSIWKHNKNFVNVYLSSARKLCSQYKQNKYIFSGKKGKATENLVHVPKEVSLIHVPGWGRIAIPICMDFLQPGYREWLVKTLKADILLCPSYSPGEYNFLQALDSNAAYGTHVIWLNSCSALRDSKTGAPELVGGACVPSVSSESRITRFEPECKGDCVNGCLFVATIPLNCIGTSGYEERRVSVEHIRAPQNM